MTVRRVRRYHAAVLSAALCATVMVAGLAAPASATPVADRDELLTALGRVFPDPHACLQGAPTTSPHANGNVCAVQFIQWDEAVAGLEYLEATYPRYVQLIKLQAQYGDHADFLGESLMSAGIPREDLTRDRKHLYVVKVTDRQSATPEPERRHFAYSLSIHGIERAGLEGGLRAAEDLATWASCENGDAPSAIDCATEGSTPDDPRRLLDPYDEDGRSPTAGEALEDGVLLFTLSNPDGWVRGDYSDGGVFYQRYNGNGMDLNRDWPTVGYSDPAYTSFSEPETRGFGRWLKWVADHRTADGHFAGGIDLHGMVTANSLSYTLLGAGQKDYRKNAITVDTAELMFRDAEERLTWSPHVAKAEDCPGPVPEPFFGQGRTTAPMCTVQWGTVWDTIEYQITGGMGDWMDNPDIGLGGVGINNEMALSHLAPNNVFAPDIVQLQIEGNKSLIYSQVTALLHEDDVAYEPGGRIAYLEDDARVASDGDRFVTDPDVLNLPTQRDLEGTELAGEGFEFVVEGVQHGFFNGGLTVKATTANARGVGAGFGAGVATVQLILDYCGPAEGEELHLTHQHAHDHAALAAAEDGEEGCTEVARYFNQAPTYLQAGAQIELNRPKPGVYRIRPNEARVTPTAYEVSFSRGDAIPGWDDQAPYDVSRTDFFTDLQRFADTSGGELVGVSVDQIVTDPALLTTFDTFVVTDRWTSSSQLDDEQASVYADTVEGFVRGGGNLVLTDGAVQGLAEMDTGVAADAVARGVYYAGYIDFNDGTGPTFDAHPLTADIERDGTASGRQTLDGTAYHDRRQTFEPVPMGYLVGGPSTCSSGCDAPIWIVDPATWADAGGLSLGRSYVRPGPNGGGGTAGVSLGELELDDGVVRIIGALLPEPTQDNFHPYGLASYGLTYTGYQLFENATTWRNPGRTEPDPGNGDPGNGEDPVEGEAHLQCDPCEITVRAGETDAIELVLTAGQTATYELAVPDAPSGWEVTIEPATVDLDADQQTPVTLSITPPRNAKGTHELAVIATDDGDAVAERAVTVEVRKGPPSDRGNAMTAAAAQLPGGGVGLLGVIAALILAAAAAMQRAVRQRARAAARQRAVPSG